MFQMTNAVYDIHSRNLNKKKTGHNNIPLRLEVLQNKVNNGKTVKHLVKHS